MRHAAVKPVVEARIRRCVEECRTADPVEVVDNQHGLFLTAFRRPSDADGFGWEAFSTLVVRHDPEAVYMSRPYVGRV